MFCGISKFNKDSHGPFYAVMDGGRGSRLSVVTLASGGKGEARLLDRPLLEITIGQISSLARQLPGNDQGWTIFAPNDTLMIPFGPIRLGGQPLFNAGQKIIMFAREINIRNAHKTDINYMKT